MARSLSLARLLEQQTGGVDGAYPTAIPGLTLYRRSAGAPPTGILYEPALCVIGQGSKRVMLGEKEFHYDAERYLLVAADLPAMAQIVGASPRTPYLGLKLLLSPLEVGEVVAQLGPTPATATRALAVSELDAALLDSVTRLVDLLRDPRDVQVLAPAVRKEIIYRLLVGPEGQRLRQLVSGTDQGQRITHVLGWLKAHFAEPLRVGALARRAGMSPTAFHRHFKEVTSLSPLQYQKQLRLQEARRLMLGEALDAAEASFKVGYESPSQFSREYRRLFGAPPRQDIESLRQASALAPVVPLAAVRKKRLTGAPVLATAAEH